MQRASFDDVLARILAGSATAKQQGSSFERACVYFLENDPLWKTRLDGVWLWADAPTKTGPDVGIDVVARDVQDGTYWAVQCKCYARDVNLTYHDVSTFFATAAGDGRYGHYMVVDTAGAWSNHLDETADAYRRNGTDVVRIDAGALRASALDWAPFLEGRPAGERTFFEPRPHQREAIDACLAGFERHDRGKLIMACGTGKTLTALRLAEELCPGGRVLFLAPSISLVAQTLRSWANQSKAPLRPFVVCSDAKASRVEDAWETSVADVPYPATTDPAQLADRVRGAAGDGARKGRRAAPRSAGGRAPLTAVFSTYQSIQTIIDAQALGMGAFDLCICDEAHRTTGARDLAKDAAEQSAFTKVHDARALKAAKRLYMTATPRVYGEQSKKVAHEANYELSSMDDEAVYGPEFFRLSFGRAVEAGLLSDYRVLVLTVSEAMASDVYQRTMAAEEGFGVPEAARILGCWKALATRGERVGGLNLYRADVDRFGNLHAGGLDVEEFDPMQRAVAFSTTVKESEDFAAMFQKVVDAFTERSGYAYPLKVECDHVDGTMDSATRKAKLRWLEEDPGRDVCRVLSNARCLSEGIDVPTLDAVMFMKPRDSQVDIVQAVGRVMRKAPGKRYGYIILPVVVPAGMSPEQALDDNQAFRTVWQVLQALRSHDERLDALINSMMIGEPGKDRSPVVVDSFDDPKETISQGELELAWTVQDWQDAMEAKLVKKCGTRVYWEDWADDVAGIAQRHIARIRDVLAADAGARAEFQGFLAGLRDSLNPGVTAQDAVEMLAQHMITRPVFEALFGSDGFAAANPVSQAMERMLAALDARGAAPGQDDAALRSLYASVRTRASVVQTPGGRQALVKELYEGFFSKAFKGTAEKMGIVYTPGEVVDCILAQTDDALRRHFGRGIASEGVHVLDPFAGTGTFMAHLIAGGLVPDDALPRKYARELHSNEIMLLPYYIMTVNIEQAYRARRAAAGHEGEGYTPFTGAVLTDTFQMHEEGDTLDARTFVENSERVLAQMETPVTAIVGNPPYSVGQKSANDNNQNESYPTLDARIAATYAARTDAVNKNALYDSYIRAFRWASDRIGNRGVVCFVTNAGWVESAAAAGMRKCLAEEFSEVRVFHLRGNARTQGEQRRREKDNVFGQGSRAPIAITLLVKDPAAAEQGRIFFHDVGSYLSREEKLALVRRAALHPKSVEWRRITPDAHGDWLNQRDDSFYNFAPLGLNNKIGKEPNGLFSCYSRGFETDRDAWVYNFSNSSLHSNVEKTIAFYSDEVSKLKKDISPKTAADVLSVEPEKISWSRTLRSKAAKRQSITFDAKACQLALYRPFCRQWVYASPDLADYPGQQPKLFPLAGGRKAPNVAICVSGTSNRDFSCLITDVLPDIQLQFNGQCFPLYWYEEACTGEDSLFGAGTAGLTRYDAVTDEALAAFRAAYPHVFKGRPRRKGGPELSKEDLFYYVYGILHSPEYRSRFAANLAKELPRVPLAADFAAFSQAGRALADLHLNYESVPPWHAIAEQGDSRNPGRTVKMRFGKKKDAKTGKTSEDRTVLEVSENLTLTCIPEAAYGYVVNGKSAVGWIMDRYQVRTDKASGIVNDPNLYSQDPRYIVNLVKRVVTVSMRTLEIVAGLPALDERPQPKQWPAAWKMRAE